MCISLLRGMLESTGLPAAQLESVFMRKSTRSRGKAYFHAPGRYRISVQGELRPDWAERFGAMQVLSIRSDDEGIVTVLEGGVRDQAELAGILNSLYELHLSLLSVRYLH
jgi:hypothetical protein